MSFTQHSSSNFRRPEPPQPLQQPPAAQEEAKIADGLHQPPDLRAGEAFPLPEVPQPGRSRRDRLQLGPHQRPGDHVVPEPEGEAEEGHGGAEEGRGERQAAQRAQELPRERPGPGDTEEEGGGGERGGLSEEPGGWAAGEAVRVEGGGWSGASMYKCK